MGHNHLHGHCHHPIEGKKRSNVLIACLLNFFFAIIELIGGILTNSTAILSDAVHDLGDSMSLGLAVLFEKYSKKPSNNTYTYGLKRLSVVGAFINIIVLSVGTAIVFSQAIERLLDPQVVMSEGMFLIALLGIAVNGFAVARMKGSKKILDKTVALHLFEDLIGWVAVLFVSVVIFFTGFYILDPILSIIICAILVRNIILSLRSALKIVMQAVPDKEIYAEISNELTEISGVQSVDDLHVWSLDGDESVVTVTIITGCESEVRPILSRAKEVLKSKNIEHSTIEVKCILET